MRHSLGKQNIFMRYRVNGQEAFTEIATRTVYEQNGKYFVNWYAGGIWEITKVPKWAINGYEGEFEWTIEED